MQARPLVTALMLMAAGSQAAESWTNVRSETEPGLAGDRIQHLEQIGDTVWIGTSDGLSTYRDGTFAVPFRHPKKPDEPLHLQVWDVHRLDDGALLIAHSRGVSTFRDGAEVDSALGGHTVKPLVPFGDTIWALAKNASTEQNTVYALSDGTWTQVAALEGRRVDGLFPASNGHIWVTLDGDGMLEIDPAEGVDAAIHHLEGLNVKAVFEDSRKRIWCGFWGRGVSVLERGSWTDYLGKEKSAILSFTESADGAIWAATSDSGVWVHEGAGWRHDLADEGTINILEGTPDGRVWVSSGSQGGLRYWDGDAWQVSLDSPFPVRALLRLGDGAMMAGGVFDGIHLKK